MEVGARYRKYARSQDVVLVLIDILDLVSLTAVSRP
jgi:hypothetical protein